MTGVQGSGPAIIEALSERVHAATDGWCDAREYLAMGGGPDVIASGDGLLLRAPRSIAELAEQVVRAHGASASALIGGRTRGVGRVLLMGRNFVMAESFRFVAH